MPDTATDAGAAASWRALGTLVQLVVAEPAALPEARRLLEYDLAEVDAACSRFRADSEIRSLRASGGQQVSPLLAEAIAVAGPVPEGGWRIRVQDVTGSPDDPPGGPYALVAIRDGGLATSSTGARRWQRGGDVLHHILDPRTGLPAEPVWRTVSVAAGTCADANAASTAAVIRGRAALGWLAQLGLPSRLVDATGAVFTVAGWPDHTSELSQNQLAGFMHLAQQR